MAAELYIAYSETSTHKIANPTKMCSTKALLNILKTICGGAHEKLIESCM